jgi:tellurite methyltransferase
MQRSIVRFETDEAGDPVAILSCGHRQHVRHKPPQVERPWVLTEAGRQAMVGAHLACNLCDDGEKTK